MIKRNLKKVMALLLAGITCVSMLGCSGGTIGKTEWQQDSKATDTESGKQEETTATGMGRYVEKTVLEFESYNVFGKIQTLSDGSLVYVDALLRKYISKDNGETWNVEEMDWQYQWSAENYCLDTAISKTGNIMMSYMPYQNYEEVTAEEEKKAKYMIVLPDGTQNQLDVDLEGTSIYMRAHAFDDQGRLFASVFDEKIYEIDTESGKVSEFLNVGEGTHYLQCQNNIMLCVGVEDIYFFDMDSKKRIEDSVLTDYIKSDYGYLKTDDAEYYNFYVFLGEDNAVYIAGKNGLYRHIIGGSSMEQIIDGNLSSFGDPSHGVVCARMVDNQEFVVRFSDDKIVKFTFDANIPTVPNNELTVYSLKEHDAIRQAMSVYQAANPDVCVEYEIGMNGEGITREDALKTLNTRLVDGSGPDILILDDMPIESYIDKGILMDISDIADQIDSKEGLFANTLLPFYQENKLYVIPAELWIFAIADENPASVGNYTAIADKVELLRKENPEKDILGAYSPDEIMKKFSMVCAPSWKDENNALNEENIREFLIESKRIYEAQMSGAEVQRNKEVMQAMQSYLDYTYFYSLNDDMLLSQRAQMLYGAILTIDNFASAMSVQRNEVYENLKVMPMKGQSSNVYCPKTLAGINAATKNIEEAEAFMKTLLGSEVQGLLYTGFPINEKAFEKVTTADPNLVSDDGTYMMYGVSDPWGNDFVWDVYWPTEEQIQLLKEWITSVETPYISDVVLEEAVYEAGDAYMKGLIDIDTAMKQILEKTAIYMAE